MATSRTSKKASDAPAIGALAIANDQGAGDAQKTRARRFAARRQHDNVAHALVRTSSAFKRLTTQRMKEEFNITGIQAEILMLLATEPAMLGNDLAAVVGVNASTVSHALDMLEKYGLLTRRRCTDDRRVVRIALTDRAKRIARRTIEITQHILDALTTGISKTDLQALQRGLKRMADNCQSRARSPMQSHDFRNTRKS
ncbi:MarR family winged helix-turn-helix transcriptional regulator [Dyella dinghuensis]|uniref:MarR family winged helix-turn-helix transcriptional regulator n=1 Tax=Dyella dinghuensis TaxID=1920169 RepID=UPI0013158566|nr:MarR family winged helix-turn-helix transcriptional regulator [Dyella dinghuensis]